MLLTAVDIQSNSRNRLKTVKEYRTPSQSSIYSLRYSVFSGDLKMSDVYTLQGSVPPA